VVVGSREEVHCGDRFPIITQKGEPTLGWLRSSRRSFHPAGDRSLRDITTQHEQLASGCAALPRSDSRPRSGRSTSSKTLRAPMPSKIRSGFICRSPCIAVRICSSSCPHWLDRASQSCSVGGIGTMHRIRTAASARTESLAANSLRPCQKSCRSY
jgi:hypothetical protein